MKTNHTVIDSVRRDAIRRLWPKVPGALAVLSECATDPCDQEAFRAAREVVLRWLQYSKACESHVAAMRSRMRKCG